MKKTQPAEPYSAEMQDMLNYKDLIHAVLEKAWLLVLCLLVSGFLGAALVKRTAPTFRAAAILQLNPQDLRIVNMQQAQPQEYGSTEMRNTFVAKMASPSLMARVVKSANLADDPRFLPPRPDGKPYSQEDLTNRLAGMISASLRDGTRLMDVKAEHTDPPTAAKLANAVAREFIKQNIERGATGSKLAMEFLEEESAKQKAKIEQSERALHDYKTKFKSVSVEDQKNLVFETLRGMNGQATALKSQYSSLVADAEQLQKFKDDPDMLLTIPSVYNAVPVASLKGQITALEGELAPLREKYKDKHPKMIQATSHIAELTTAMREAALKTPALIQSEVEKLGAQKKAMEEAVAEQELAALELDRKSIDYNVLARQVETDRSMYQAILNRVGETSVTKELETDAIQLVQDADIPGAPFKPNVTKIMALSLSGGLILALALIYALYLLDTSIKTVDQAEQITALSVVAAIPEVKVKRGDKVQLLPTLETPASDSAEAFRSLRASLSILLKTAQGVDIRSLLVTSALPGEGKSFSCMNYAIILAQQGVRVLLVDADLRRPALHSALLEEKMSRKGLAEYLGGTDTLDTLIVPTKVPGLSLLPAGVEIGKPAELLANGRSKLEALKNLAPGKFDFLIFDTAPINILGDTSLILPVVETVALVVRAAHTPRRAVTRAIELIEQSQGEIAGLVLNRLPVNARSPYYYGYYRYHTEKYGKRAYAEA